MSYHGLGAGPGPTETYYVDMPFPWGENTELKLTLFVIEPIRTGIVFDESVRNSDRIRMQSDIVFKF